MLRHAELQALRGRPAGLVVVDGAPFSHPMIRLLRLGIPTVVVTACQAEALTPGAPIAVDGDRGLIDIQARGPSGAKTPKVAALPARTRDGVAVGLRASVADREGARRALTRGADAIGLVRSEFLVPEGDKAPDRAFYIRAIAALCEAARPLPVTLRLIDIAADKRPPWLGPVAGLEGPLGLQGVRLYDNESVQAIVRAQLEAVATLATDYRIRLLLPYVSDPQEFSRWRDWVQGLSLTRPLPVGAMLETPAAALAIPEILALADFAALGCNDLMQCLFGADRDIGRLSGYLDPYAPALLRFLRQVAQAAGQGLERIQLCGLLPLFRGLAPVLLGLGYRHLSVEPALIPRLAGRIAQTHMGEAEALAGRVCAATGADRVRALVGLPPGLRWAMG